MLRKCIANNQQDWEDMLPQCLFALRSSENASTKMAPYQLLFGRSPSYAIDIAFGNPPAPPTGSLAHHDYVQKLRQRIDAAQEYARTNMEGAIRRQRRRYHQDRHEFLPGEKVWLFTPAIKPGESRKLATHWSGPWMIVEPINKVLFRILPHPEMRTMQPEQVVSIDRLKLFREPHPRFKHTEPPTFTSEHDEFVEWVAPANAPPAPPPAPPAPPALPRRPPAQQQRQRRQRPAAEQPEPPVQPPEPPQPPAQPDAAREFRDQGMQHDATDSESESETESDDDDDENGPGGARGATPPPGHPDDDDVDEFFTPDRQPPPPNSPDTPRRNPDRPGRPQPGDLKNVHR
jgi:hypothetical protein